MSAIQGWLAAVAVAIVALLGWHYLALRDEAAKVPGLEQQVADRNTAIKARDDQAVKDAADLARLNEQITAIRDARASAEAELQTVTSAIRETAAATAEKLADAIPDNPDCRYGSDVGRLLNQQLLGLRPGHSP
ncbi:hypothetical protein sos41_31460 [Alphaproteobacteria bacterium SO-S41]|nr:hypothetical protein sos41_31460 [Alphaproteobacteria bacterium SO-S41]